MARETRYINPDRRNDIPEYDDESTSQYVESLQPIKQRRKNNARLKIIALILVVLAAVGIAAYWFFFRPEPQQPTVVDSTNTTEEDQSAQIQAGMETYKSASMNLQFDHKNTWTIDDSTEGIIRAQSPIVKLSDINGDQSDAKVVLSILEKGSEVPGFNESGARAVADSEKLTYLNPSQIQRAETYISFAGFGMMGLDSVLVSGDSGYKQDQYIPEEDVKNGDPIILIQFFGCDDAVCEGEGAGPYTVDIEEWSSNEALLDSRQLLESLRVEL